MSGDPVTRDDARPSGIQSILATLRGEIPGVWRLVPILVLIMTFAILDRWFLAMSRLPAKSYEETAIVVETLQHVPRLGWRVAIVGVLLIIVIAFRYRCLGCRWSTLEHGRALRILVTTAAFLLAWCFSFYDFNLYYNQPHSIDRTLIVVLFLATLWRPVFVLPFLCVLFPVIGQLHQPIGGDSWIMHSLALGALVLFTAMLLMGFALRCWKTSHFVFAVGCLYAGHYWPSGLAKLRLGWLIHDHFYLLLPATYANGWLGFLEPETIASLTRLLSTVNLPVKVATLALECGAVFFLWKRPASLILLGGWILFHGGIFLVSGICFWPWVVLDAVLLVLLWRIPELSNFGLSTGWQLLASVLLIGSSPVWLRPGSLSWLDAAATYTYRFEAVGQSGTRYSLPPGFFAPYDFQFTLGMFAYLTPDRTLPIAWGATTDKAVAARLLHAKSAEHVIALERELGTIKHRADATAKLELFLKRFVENHNNRGSNTPWFRRLRAPRLLWTFPRRDALKGQEKIARVKGYQVLSFFNGEDYQEIRELLILEVEVSPTQGNEEAD